jgi:hypothetical protein
MTTAAQFGEALETFKGSGKKDSKGREIGFIVGFNDNGADFHAWVQAARRTGPCEFADFGVRQRSKRFASQSEATRWAYSAACERIAKLSA